MAPMLIALAAVRWPLWAQGTMCEHLTTSIIIMMLLIRLHSTFLFACIPSTCLCHRCPPTSSHSPIINANELHYISANYACKTILYIYIYICRVCPFPQNARVQISVIGNVTMESEWSRKLKNRKPRQSPKVFPMTIFVPLLGCKQPIAHSYFRP